MGFDTDVIMTVIVWLGFVNSAVTSKVLVSFKAFVLFKLDINTLLEIET